MRPMLATEANPAQAAALIADPAWWLQQKIDGDRLLVRVDGGEVTFLNRRGESRSKAVPAAITAFFARVTEGVWYFDGELIDGELWLFDLIVEGLVSASDPYADRMKSLEMVMGRLGDGPVRLLPTARTAAEKAALVAAVTDVGGEGWVLKHHEIRYESGGRSARMLKIKRTHTADLVVTRVGIDGKDNAELGLYEDGELVVVGRCSLLGKPAVEAGDVVEIRFLYVGANGRLYQPTLLKVRDDKAAGECVLSQLYPFQVNKTVVLAA